MILTRKNFPSVLTTLHKKFFFDEYTAQPTVYDKIFKVEDMDQAEEKEQHMGGFGEWQKNTEGNSFNQDEMSEGDEVTYTAERYDKAYTMTWELVQDDYKKVLKGLGKGGSAKQLGKGLNTAIEKLCASILSNGFTNVGYDGVSLFNSAHPLTDSTETVDNLATGALSTTNLELAITKLGLQKDEAGNAIMMTAGQLIVHPANEFNARKILNSALVSENANNNKNVLPNLEIIVNPYLATTTEWYVKASNYDENLKFKWREKPIFDSEKIGGKMDWLFFGYARFCAGYSNWRGIVGSTGL